MLERVYVIRGNFDPGRDLPDGVTAEEIPKPTMDKFFEFCRLVKDMAALRDPAADSQSPEGRA